MPRHPRSYHYRHRHPVYMGRYPTVLPLLFVLLAVSGVAGIGVLLALVVIGAGVVGPIAFTGAVLVRNRRNAALREAAAQRRPARRVPAPPSWQDAQNRFAALRTEYAGFECDPVQVLTLPALADVSVPSTERFVEAFAEAQALDTDTEPAADHSAAYVAAVDRACRAWTAAKDAAERIRLSRLGADERACVQRVIKLLTMAQDTDNDAERLSAYGRARSELVTLERAGTVLVPQPAHAMLDAACRGELPAGSYGRVER